MLKQLALKQVPFEKMTHTKSLKVFITRFIPCDSNSLSFLCSCDRICTHVRISRGNSCARGWNTLPNIIYYLQNRQRALANMKNRVAWDTRTATMLAFISICWFSARRAWESDFSFSFFVVRERESGDLYMFFILASPDAQRESQTNERGIYHISNTDFVRRSHSLFHGARVGSNYWPVHLSPNNTHILSRSLTRNVYNTTRRSLQINAHCVCSTVAENVCWWRAFGAGYRVYDYRNVFHAC